MHLNVGGLVRFTPYMGDVGSVLPILLSRPKAFTFDICAVVNVVPITQNFSSLTSTGAVMKR
jgi:hypothetical protein